MTKASASDESKTAKRKRQRSSGNDTVRFAAPKRRKNPANNEENRKAAGEKMQLRTSNMLRLVLEPSATPVRRRRLGRHVCLDVGRGNKVFGSVNGRRCTVQLDSGSSISFMFFTLAKVLQLLSGNERTETQLFHLWIDTMEVEVIQLEEVVVTLEGQVEVRTPLHVLPKSLEKYYDPEDLVLGVHVLRRGFAVQTFSKGGGSTLHVRRPKSLQTKPRARSHPGGCMCSFWARGTQLDARLMEVLLDTGAEGFFMSKNTGEEIMECETELAAPPRGVSLALGDDSYLEAWPLEVIPMQEVDFVMGEELLYRYEAVLDYGRHFLDLTVDGKHFRVNLDGE